MDAVACRLCGVATDRRLSRRKTFAGLGYADTAETPGSDYRLGVCDTCVTLLPDEPGATVRAVLRLLGEVEANWAEWADAFGDLELGAVEYDQVGLPQGSRRRGRPQASAWAHVGPEVLAVLREQRARHLDLRARLAAAIPGPSEGPPSGAPACLLCGVARSSGWRRVLTGALTPGPALVEGCLCATCAAVLDAVGALGPALVERACREALGLAAAPPGLRAWVATGRVPGAPWEWAMPAPPADASDLLQARVDALAVEVAAVLDRVSALEGRFG